MSLDTRRLAKINSLPPEEALNLIYEWTKTGHIGRSEFRALIAHVTTPETIDDPEPCSDSGFVK